MDTDLVATSQISARRVPVLLRVCQITFERFLEVENLSGIEKKLYASKVLTSFFSPGYVLIFKVSSQCRSGSQNPIRFYSVLQSLLKAEENTVKKGPSFCCDALSNFTLSQILSHKMRSVILSNLGFEDDKIMKGLEDGSQKEGFNLQHEDKKGNLGGLFCVYSPCIVNSVKHSYKALLPWAIFVI